MKRRPQNTSQSYNDKQLRKAIQHVISHKPMEPATTLHEGFITDMFVGLLNTVLRLFGVEIKQAEKVAYTEASAKADTLVKQIVQKNPEVASLKTKKGQPISSYRELDPKNKTHRRIIKKVAANAVNDALKGVTGGLTAMEDVPPFPEQPSNPEDKEAAKQYKAHEEKMKKGAASLGLLLGATKFLGDKYPEFKTTHSQIAGNTPTTPADVFYQAGVLSKQIQNSEIFAESKEPSQRLIVSMDDLLILDESTTWDIIKGILEEQGAKSKKSIAKKGESLRLRFAEKILDAGKDTLVKMFGADSKLSQKEKALLLTALGGEGAKGVFRQVAYDLDSDDINSLMDEAKALTDVSDDEMFSVLKKAMNLFSGKGDKKSAKKVDIEKTKAGTAAALADTVTQLSSTYLSKHGLSLGGGDKLPSTSSEDKELALAAEKVTKDAKKAASQEEFSKASWNPGQVIRLAKGDDALLTGAIALMGAANGMNLIKKLNDPDVTAGVISKMITVNNLTSDEVGKLLDTLKITDAPAPTDFNVDGTALSTDIIQRLDKELRQAIGESPELSDEAKTALGDKTEPSSKIETFADIKTFPKRAVVGLLKLVDGRTLTTALKFAPTDVTDYVLSNMSNRAATMIREDMEKMSKDVKKQSYEAQELIIQLVKDALNDGKMSLDEALTRNLRNSSQGKKDLIKKKSIKLETKLRKLIRSSLMDI